MEKTGALVSVFCLLRNLVLAPGPLPLSPAVDVDCAVQGEAGAHLKCPGREGDLELGRERASRVGSGLGKDGAAGSINRTSGDQKHLTEANAGRLFVCGMSNTVLHDPSPLFPQ